MYRKRTFSRAEYQARCKCLASAFYAYLREPSQEDMERVVDLAVEDSTVDFLLVLIQQQPDFPPVLRALGDLMRSRKLV